MTIAGILQVAKRDFVARARSRAFLITTLLTVGLIGASVPLVGSAIGDSPAAVVGTVGPAPEGLAAAIDPVAAAADVELELRAYPDRRAAEIDLEEGEIEVVLLDGATLLWQEQPDPRLGAVIAEAVQTRARRDVAADLGLSAEQAARMLAPVTLTEEILAPMDDAQLARLVAAQVGSIVLYLAIIIFGQFILTGVLEEKQNRVVEVVLSRIPPSHLLAGKVMGIGALGLIQVTLIIAVTVASASMIDLPGVDLSGLSFEVGIQVLLWFLLGFAFYAAMYGGLGATISRQEDTQGPAMIPTLILVAAYFVSIEATRDPSSTLAIVSSLVPLTSPIVMPVRVAVGAAAVWELLAAVVLLIGATAGLILVAGRVYRGAVLQVGKRVKLRDAWKASASAR